MPAAEEDAARRFYVEILGFEEVPKPAELAARGGLWLRSGSTALHLGVDNTFVPASKAHPAFRCAQYDALLGELRAAGITVSEDPLPFQGKRHCYIADPFGNRIELIDL
jgi:catechol 2,3-dioxygenase-like lactoylglutathione lyase family enzyme